MQLIMDHACILFWALGVAPVVVGLLGAAIIFLLLCRAWISDLRRERKWRAAESRQGGGSWWSR